MKKDDSRAEMRDGYERKDFPAGLHRNKFGQVVRAVVLEPDVAAAFPTSEAVNAALRSLMQKDATSED